MKTLQRYIILFLFFFHTITYSQLKIPSLSPVSEIKQKIGLTEVVIEYSRPSVRERVIFGDLGLLPANEVWRTGANSATKLTFSKDVFIKGNLLKKGSYTILSYPEEKLWKMKWYQYSKSNWNFYKDKKPVFEVELPVFKLTAKVETFEIHFQNITFNSADIILEWENTKIKIPIKLDENKAIFNAITKTLSGPSSFDYYQAALYFHETKTDIQKALYYIQKVTQSKNALFFQVTREAMILKDLGMRKEALKVANRALVLSEKADNDDFIRLNKNIIKTLYE